MSFECKYLNHSGLAKETRDLLEQIDAFEYSLLSPKFKTLGELHKTLTVEITNNIDDTYIDEHITIADIKQRIHELESQMDIIRKYEREIWNRREATTDYDLRDKLECQLRHPARNELARLKEALEENINRPDNYEVTIKWTKSLNGYYTRTRDDAKIVLKHIYGINAPTYIHEMMHAYYDADRLGDSPNCIEYVEEPLAEYAMLHFLYAFAQEHPNHKQLLTDAINSVNQKQYTFGLYHYAFGEYLYQNYSNIPWEEMMLKAKNKIDVTSHEYQELQKIFQSRPNKNKYDETAQLLYDILTKACEKPQTTITKQTKGITPSKHIQTNRSTKNDAHQTEEPSVVIVEYSPPFESKFIYKFIYDYHTTDLQYYKFDILYELYSSSNLDSENQQKIKDYLSNRQNIEDFFQNAVTEANTFFERTEKHTMKIEYGNRRKMISNSDWGPWTEPFRNLLDDYICELLAKRNRL